MPNAREQILEVAKAHSETVWDICTEVWKFILRQKKDVRKEYFYDFLSQISFDDVVDENHQQLLSDASAYLDKDIIDLVNRILENLIQQRVSDEVFYNNLWDKICDTTLLPDCSAQISFLMVLWLDPRIPYYQLGEGCIMDDEEYKKVIERIWPDLQKAFFVLFAPLPQKTQRASLLMELADGLQNEQEKIVFWADIIARLRSISQIRESSSEDETR